MNLMRSQKVNGGLARIGVLVTVLGACLLMSDRADAAAAKVTLLKTDGSRETGFVQDSNAKQILFAYTPTGKGQAINLSGIKSIFFQEEADILARGRSAFSQGYYEPASQIFGKIATDYEGISAVKENFACEARFFQLESLRRLGKYEELGALLETKSGKSIDATQNKLFGEQVKLLKIWAAFAASKWDEVKAGLKFYEVPQVGDAKMLPVPVFKKMPKPTMIQLSYIRGKMYEQEKKLEHALEDYYRAFTITYGNEPTLTNQAMLAALAIEAADPKLKELQTKQWQMQGLAYYYKSAVGGGAIPAEYSEYAVIPDLPVAKPPEAEEEEKKKKETEDAAKTSEAVADKKAEDEKKAKEGGDKKEDGKKKAGKKGKKGGKGEKGKETQEKKADEKKK